MIFCLRKNSIHIKQAALFLLITVINIAITSCSKNSATTGINAMDTFMTIRSYGAKAESANKQVEQKIRQIEKLISVTDTESQVYKINNSMELPVINAAENEELYELVKFALECAEKTEGAFNPLLYPVTKTWGFTTKNYKVPDEAEITEKLKLCDYRKVKFIDETKVDFSNTIELAAGMALDFGAIGKGYAGDKAIEVLKAAGIKSGILDLGGNIQLLGTKPDGSDWNIGLKNPWGGDIPLALKLKDCAVITSGGYERFFTADDGKEYIHIFDGRTGYPVNNNVVSSTIITKSGLYGDFLSTATFILGKQGAQDLWKSYGDFEFIMIFEDHSICYTKGLKDKISILGNFTQIQVIE